MIFKKETLKQENYTEAENAFHIAFGIDLNFVMGMGILMNSILMHNEDRTFSFHVFTDAINEADFLRLNALIDKFPKTIIKIYYLDKSRLHTLPTGFTWTTAIYHRFIIGEALHEGIERVLYLDSDILCVNKIGELEIRESNIVAAVQDGEVPEDRIQKLCLQSTGEYFSSGVLYIDILKWRSENIAERAIDLLLMDKGIYQFYDQDVLNQLMCGHVDYIEEKYNYIYNLVFMKKEIPENTIFIHYTGSSKPWQLWAQGHPAADLYLKYKDKSPWADVEIQKPVTYKQAKFMARACLRKKQYIKMLFWEVRYGIWKMLRKK